MIFIIDWNSSNLETYSEVETDVPDNINRRSIHAEARKLLRDHVAAGTRPEVRRLYPNNLSFPSDSSDQLPRHDAVPSLSIIPTPFPLSISYIESYSSSAHLCPTCHTLPRITASTSLYLPTNHKIKVKHR